MFVLNQLPVVQRPRFISDFNSKVISVYKPLAFIVKILMEFYFKTFLFHIRLTWKIKNLFFKTQK
jgi:hypothetical protein